MIVYPAIDLMSGRCVRLRQGRFERATVYPADPADTLARFAEAGASWAHIVDLDGARAGTPRQHQLIARLANASSLKLQVAGGFRTRDEVARMIDAGAGRVIVGSLAIHNPSLVQDMFETFGSDRLGLAFDVNLADGRPIVATSGWTECSGRGLYEAAQLHPRAKHLLVTDIGRDGMLQGPNLRLMEEAMRRLPRRAIQSSGGVRDLDDLRRLKAARTKGVVVGKALWEGELDLAEAVACARA